MTSYETPLDIAELLDHILAFVDSDADPHSSDSLELSESWDRFRDLRACALVTRSWAHAAQALLYSNIRVGMGKITGEVLLLLLRTLQESPHLAANVWRLEVLYVEPHVLKQLGSIPFPRLNNLYVIALYTESNSDEVDAGILGIQHLLQNPCLFSLRIYCQFPRLEDYVRVWDGCSGSITDLAYSSRHNAAPELENPPQVQNPLQVDASRGIKLDFFAVVDYVQSRLWLQPFFPFDLSALKAFQLHGPMDEQLSDLLTATLQTIEVFSLTPSHRADGIIPDLPRMSQIELTICFPYNTDFDFLRTIRARNRDKLRAIELNLDRSRESELVDRRTRTQALATHLSKIQQDFPNIQIVSIHLPLPRYSNSLYSSEKEEWEKFLEGLDFPFTLRWGFARKQVPWHTKLA
ncbi:hypothetical protein FB45DRAFT_935617 [Roridomyces roridus]|uniref:F-box domain-containing protein n=1 Tax=Roridomyces roridus TaxID=1738132 RepID=A0AAD7BB53_9AGAR|nr:hypothetical protein FB45DRAFT_935617 [Roridomyces roridus]